MEHRFDRPCLRAATFSLCALVVASCGGARSLGYTVPADAAVGYVYGDTTELEISLMGQRMRVAQRGTARYDVSFAPVPEGVAVTLSVAELEGAIEQPLGGSIGFDEEDVSGILAFVLDREGNATVTRAPEVTREASLMVSGPGLAHMFFPGLPDRRVTAGDAWADTVSFEGVEASGRRSERYVMAYRVRGDTAVDGRALTVIDVTGTNQTAAELSLSGMTVQLSADVEIEGEVLWDVARGIMYSSHSRASGQGRVTAPMLPNPAPVRIDARRTARVTGR